jgi:hypothetical protein
MSALLHHHILVVYHLHPRDILLHPIGHELILLPVGQEVVDGVLQPTLVAMDPGCDGLPGGISNNIAVRGPISWSLVSAEDSGSEENLCDGFELHPPWTRDFLDPIPGSGGDAQVFQQSSKPAGENWSFDPEGLHLISISYIFSSSASLEEGYSLLALSSTSWSFGCCCSSVGES